MNEKVQKHKVNKQWQKNIKQRTVEACANEKKKHSKLLPNKGRDAAAVDPAGYDVNNFMEK